MKTYKGFNSDMTCLDYKFEIGKTYEEPAAEVCQYGFHSCKYPLDVFAYYPPARSRYCEVEADGVISQSANDRKIASTKLTVNTEIGIKGIIDATAEYVFDHPAEKYSPHSSDSCGVALSACRRGVASSAGKQSIAAAGEYGAAITTGTASVALTTEICSTALSKGVNSAALMEGDLGEALTTDRNSAALVTGKYSVALSTGDGSIASSTGDRGTALAIGDFSEASAMGEKSIACGLGRGCKAKGAKGCWLVLAEQASNSETYESVQAVIVDGEKIKENTYYMLINGEIVEADGDISPQDLLPY